MEYEKAYDKLREFEKLYKYSVKAEKDFFYKPKMAEKALEMNPLNEYLNNVESSYKKNDTILIDNKKLVQNYSFTGKNHQAELWFNASIARFNDNYILCYRTDKLDKELNRYCVYINLHLVRLDLNYNVISDNHTLDLLTVPTSFLDKAIVDLPKNNHAEDPRIIIYNDELYIFYTDGFKQLIAILDPITFKIKYNKYLDKPFDTNYEKNWTPIIIKNQLNLIYSVSPFFTLMTLDNKKPCHINNILSRRNRINDLWEWGQIRGGTPWIETHDKKYYISVFHSSKNLTPIIEHSKIYVAGLLVMNKDLEIVGISKKPLMAPSLYTYNKSRLNQNIFVIFPCGFLYNKGKYIISMGYNDCEIRILEIKKNKILNDINFFN